MLIKNCSYIVTQDEKRRVLKDYDILIEEDTIVNISKNIPGKGDMDGSGKVFLPGLINTHTHIGMHLLKGVCDDEELNGWLQVVVPAERKQTARQIKKGAALACKEMIETGTTTFCDMWWNTAPIEEAVREAGLRAVLTLGVNEEVPEGYSAKKLLSEAETLLQKNDHNKMIRYGLECHSIYRNSKRHLEMVAALAIKYDALLGIHIAETRKERFDSQKANDCLPIEFLEKCNFLSKKTILVHTIWITKGEIGIIKKYDTKVSHNPVSNMKLASGGVMPLPEMHEAGVTVGLGTDSAASNNNLDMFEEMKLVGLLHKHHRWDPKIMDSQKILDMATIEGAKLLGMEHDIGSLEIGKKADIISLSLDDYNMQPLNDLLSNIVYASRGGNVRDVVINGKVILRDRAW